jgi:hypothetical protein
LKHLTGADLVEDESGYLCVHVKRGKGGKEQLQRIEEDDIPLVRSYFEGVGANERIFPDVMLDNELNLHALRAECAKKYYFATLLRIQKTPGYAQQLKKEICARWFKYCRNKGGTVRPLPQKELEGEYVVRGLNRELAIRKGMPIRYNRLALLAASIFKLSHWRNNVTVASYLLV